jgi:hypothetical protein
MGKVLRYGFFALILIVLIIALVPWLFRGQIFEMIKQEANNNLKGQLEIADMDLTLFRDFPNLTLTLEELAYTCDAPFEGTKLFDINKVRAEIDLFSVFGGGKIKVNSISVYQPVFNVKILEDGTSNYDILKEDSTVVDESAPTEASAFSIGLKSFLIEGMQLAYEDAEGDMSAILKDANMLMKGDLTQDETDLAINSTITGLSYTYGSVEYITETAVKADINVHYNQTSGRITLKENEVWLNALNLLFAGWVESYDEKVSMDLTFEAPKTDFKELLSLVPIVYMNDFEGLKTSGRFVLKGYSKGEYFYEGDNMPEFGLTTTIDNGSLKYPDLPSSLSNIFMEMAIAHPQGELDLIEISIPKASLQMAGSPFAMTLFVKTPMTDPFIDFTVKTDLNLAKLQDVIQLEGTRLSGILKADAAIRGLLSQFENGQYDQVKAQGYIQTQKMVVEDNTLTEPVYVDTLYTAISPQVFSLNPLIMRIGSSDFSGRGQLTNMLAYVLTDDTLRGGFTVDSRFINVTELMNSLAPTEETPTTEASASADTLAFRVPANLDITIKAKADSILYDDLNLKNVSADLVVYDEKVKMNNVLMDFFGGKIGFDGTYSMVDEKPKFDMELRLQNLDAALSFKTMNTVQAFAPIAESAIGTFGGSLKMSSFLGNDYMPDLSSLTASGNILTQALKIQPAIMQKISDILQNQAYSNVGFTDANLSFGISEGRVNVNPIKLKIGDVAADFSGSHGLDQTMSYSLKTNVPLDKIQLPEEIKALNLNKGTIPVEFLIGGTLTKPTVKPVFGQGQTVKDMVTDIVTNVVNQATDSVVNTVNREAEKIMADAKAQADALIANAEKQVAALKAESQKQADSLKAEARKQAQKLKDEAKGDPLKEFGAKTAADLAIKEADKKVDALYQQTNKQADKIMADARKQADTVMKDAEEKAKIKK